MDKASWHDRYKHSAYVFAGGLAYELTEGDLLAVFSQYGEVVDVHLVRDKKTGEGVAGSVRGQRHERGRWPTGGGGGGRRAAPAPLPARPTPRRQVQGLRLPRIRGPALHGAGGG